MKTKLKVLAAAVGLVSASQGFAQQGANAEGATVLEEVLITARKQEESLMQIPVSVSVVDAKQIKAANLNSINDLVNTTPGLKFNSAFGRQADRPVVRSISAIQTANELAGFFVDGVYVAGSLQTFDLDSIARVEVLKGPQSSTFGRRTFSGAVNYVTRVPTEEFTAKLKAEAGSNGYRVLAGGASDTVGKFGYRVNLRDYSYDGDFDNTVVGGPDVGGQETTSANATLVFDVSDATSITFNVNYAESDDEHFPVQLQPSSDNNCSFPAARAPREYYCGTIKADTPIALGGFAPASFYGTESDVLRTYIKIDHDFGNDLTLNWTSAYNDSEAVDGRDVSAKAAQLAFSFVPFPSLAPATGWHATFDEESEDFSHELWLNGKVNDRFSWRAGLYTYSEETTVGVFEADGGLSARNGIVDKEVDNDALMLAFDYDVTADVTVGLELRYAEDDISTTIFNGFTTSVFEDTFDSLTHRLSASWNIDESTMLYGSWSIGVLPGEFNTSSLLPENLRSVDEQELEQFEIGVKADLSHTVRLTAAVYMLEWKDQVRSLFFVAPGLPSPIGYSANEGTSEITGLEADVSWLATENLSLKLGFSYNDTEIKDFISTDATDLAITGDGDLSGNQMPLSPEWDAYANATHTADFGDGFTLTSRVDVSYQDTRFVRVSNLAETGDATLVNLSLALEKENWRIALWGKNVTDEDSAVSILRFLEADSFFFAGTAFQLTPRTGAEWGVTLTYDF